MVTIVQVCVMSRHLSGKDFTLIHVQISMSALHIMEIVVKLVLTLLALTFVPGSYICSCSSGYVIESDGHNCTGQ